MLRAFQKEKGGVEGGGAVRFDLSDASRDESKKREGFLDRNFFFLSKRVIGDRQL